MDQKYATFYESSSTWVHHWNFLTRQWDIEQPGVDAEGWWIEDPEVLPDSDPKHLCDLCRHVNFNLLLQEQGILSSRCSHSLGNCLCIDLGLLAHTLERPRCAFCKLIIWKISQKRVCHTTQPKLFGKSQQLQDKNPDGSVRLSVVTTGSPKVSRLRIRISHADSPVNEDFFLQKFGDDPGDSRVVSSQIDRSLPRFWLEKCEWSHEKYPVPDWKSLGTDLDLIDTRNNCIATVVRDRRYAALSYVWGGNQSLQLNSQTEHLLRRPGGLKKVRLPETIRDAVRLTKSLGLRYLWVDSICIVQDDKKRRDKLLSNMGWIYENATVTIVAASNKNARQGLPGVKSVARMSSQMVVDIQGLQMAAVINSPEDPLEDVKIGQWSTRGWTFQEGLLSRRLLFLTSQQMIFVCKHQTCFEDTNGLHLTAGEKVSVDDAELPSPVSIAQGSNGELVPESQQGLLRDSGWRCKHIFF